MQGVTSDSPSAPTPDAQDAVAEAPPASALSSLSLAAPSEPAEQRTPAADAARPPGHHRGAPRARRDRGRLGGNANQRVQHLSNMIMGLLSGDAPGSLSKDLSAMETGLTASTDAYESSLQEFSPVFTDLCFRVCTKSAYNALFIIISIFFVTLHYLGLTCD
jgi:hypothetical protein